MQTDIKDTNEQKSPSNSFNKNEKQREFNTVIGMITEINEGDKFGSITLNVGQQNVRQVNLIVKKQMLDYILSNFKICDRVSMSYYLTSRFKNGRWYTMANVLGIEMVKIDQ